MFFKLHSAGMVGIECVPVTVEIDLHKGQTQCAIVGLADTSIKEAKDRIYSAIKNAGFTYPFNFRILINLAPADAQKEGAAYDLPMAVGIIAASTDLRVNMGQALMVGELALDGGVRHVPGVLPLALYAKAHDFTTLFVPESDALEAALVKGLTIFPVKDLRQLVEHLQGSSLIEPFVPEAGVDPNSVETPYDLALVKGQPFAKRALEIAAAGGHNLLFNGPPGSGKTLLARTLPSILPPLTEEEILEVTKLYSAAGLIVNTLLTTRPFRTPHHTASSVALVGGGRLPRPGEISLAHRGVLFLDELPEFSRFVIESLRQPLEDGVVTIARSQGTLTFPARFMLLASQNPCPCGYATDPTHRCTCTPLQLVRYRKKMSGPLLDRIDLHVEVPPVPLTELVADSKPGESSATVRERVVAARARQHKRFAKTGVTMNSDMRPQDLRRWCRLEPPVLQLIEQAAARWHLSARAYNRLLKVSRTIADLAGSAEITREHLAEALQLRFRQEI